MSQAPSADKDAPLAALAHAHDEGDELVALAPPQREALDEHAGLSAAAPWHVRLCELPRIGLVCIIAASALYSVQSLIIKLTGARVPTMQQIFFRTSLSLAASCLIMRWQKTALFSLSRELSFWCFLRGMSGFLNMFVYFWSLNYISLADAQVIAFMSTILTGIVGRVFLKEAFGLVESAATLAAFVGIVLIVQPAFVFGAHAGASAAPPGVTGQQRLLGVLVALLGVVFGTGVIVFNRKVGTAVSVHVLTFYVSACSTVGSMLAMAATRNVASVSLGDAMLLLVMSLTAYAGLLCFNRGCQLEDAVVSSLARVADLPFAMAWQLLLLSERLTLLGLLGTLCVVSAVVALGVHKHRQQQRRRRDEQAAALPQHASSDYETSPARPDSASA